MLIDGARKHIMGYLQDFLFSPDRVRQPVRSLSGGERNRLLLARLCTLVLEGDGAVGEYQGGIPIGS